MPTKAKETPQQVREKYARRILRIIHPTVAPYRIDVQRVAEAIREFHEEVSKKGRKT